MDYKVGDKIGKYTITHNFSTLNAGRCEWGFATYNGHEYFIKRFLSPVYPGKDAPGSEEKKKEKRKRCQDFEARYTAIKKALSHLGEAGLIVQPVDFFKYGKNPNQGEHYFKVFHKVDTNSIKEDIHQLPTKERLLIMVSVAYTISELHFQKIIHFDIKTDNILVEKSWATVGKLIDFDDSIIVGEVIKPEEIVADFTYYSPELAQYIETGGETLTPDLKSDIFSLGLVFSQYWMGNFPPLAPNFTYAHEAILKGDKLVFRNPNKSRIKKSKSLGKCLETSTKLFLEEQVIQLIEDMLVSSPKKRPTAQEVHNRLKIIYREI